MNGTLRVFMDTLTLLWRIQTWDLIRSLYRGEENAWLLCANFSEI